MHPLEPILKHEPQTLSKIVLSHSFWLSVIKQFIHKRGFDAVSVLAYTSLLSLIPLLAVVVSLLSSSVLFQDAANEAVDQMLKFILPSAGENITGYLKQFTTQAAHLKGIGLGVLFVTVLLLLKTIDEKMNWVMSEHDQRHWGVSLLQYLGVTLLGPLLIGASVLLGSYLSALPFIAHLAEKTDWFSSMSFLLLSKLPVVLNGLGFTLLYKTIPYGHIHWRVALFGGLLTTLWILLFQKGFAFYLAWFPTYNLIYGAFAVIPIFLVWLYLIWWVVLFNATATKQLQDRLFPKNA